MRLTLYLTLGLLTFPLIGCDQTPVVVASTEALFCDVEQPRRFTREELVWRSQNAPDNLRLDHKTNAAWDRECMKDDAR